MLLEKKIPFIYFINKIKLDILYTILFAVVANIIPNYWPHLIPPIPLAVPIFLGSSISILLSFKLNQAYDRWWEARKIWGAIVNDSRTLILQLQTYLPKSENEQIKLFAKRQIAWCYCLSDSLRKTDNKKETDFLQVKEIEELKNHKNRPLALLQAHSYQLSELKSLNKITEYSFVETSLTIKRLTDNMGMAERIKNTVFPSSYSLILHFAIYLFVITLSISLDDIQKFHEIPLLLLIAGVFFLLERSATHMQNPFSNKPSDIPTLSISRTIEQNLMDLTGEKAINDEIEDFGYYTL